MAAAIREDLVAALQPDAKLRGKGQMTTSEIPVPDPSGGGRLPELDSLRGVAALTVVLLHFHDRWLMSSTPTHRQVFALFLLRPFYGGVEAVILFFILSGFVLSLPYLRGKGQPYRRYLTRRVLRIYGPHLGALSIAIASAAYWHNHGTRVRFALHLWSKPINPSLVLQNVMLIGYYDWPRYNFVLWSLAQEMRISIFFPLLVAFVIKVGAVRSLFTGVILSATMFLFEPLLHVDDNWIGFPFTVHLVAFFLIGIVLASHLSSIRNWWQATSRGTHVALTIGSLLLYSFADAFMIPLLNRIHVSDLSQGRIDILMNYPPGIGAAGFILIALCATPVRSLLRTAPFRLLGRISYSLYLLHPIVLLTLTFALGDRVNLLVQLAIYLIAVLFCSWLFCLLVEERFISWSRRV